MSKKLKMVIYGEPGEGKSTFISRAKCPFFIATDGNFDWLGLPDENHVEISSFTQFKQVIKDMIENPAKYAKFDVVAVDLLEDVFKWCEYEFCQKNKIQHVSDIGYGKAYDITRNEFYIEVCKLLGLDKHVVLIAHGYTEVTTNNRGIQNTKYLPSNRVPAKVWDMIEGRVRYFLRVFSRDEETTNGKFVKRRYLSLIPKEGEYGIARGLDESVTPEDITLDWNTFIETIGLNSPVAAPVVETISVKEEPKTEEAPRVRRSRVSKPTEEAVPTHVEETPVKEEPTAEVVEEKPVETTPVVNSATEEHTAEKVEETPVVPTPTPVVTEPAPTPVVTEPAASTPVQPSEESMADRIARIRAKYAK